MNSKQIRNSLLLVITAFIWGVAFVAQSTGGDRLGAFTFNGLRCLIGAIFLVPAIIFFDTLGVSKKPVTRQDKKNLYTGGFCCGVLLFIATTLQQLGITSGTEAGKAGFLSSCYILLVPVFGFFFKRKCGLNAWVSVGIAVAGLYFLCVQDSFALKAGDILLLMSAVGYALQIMAVDRFSPLCDGVRLSCLQFLTAGLIGMIPMLVVDVFYTMGGFRNWLALFMNAGAWIALLYAGVLSCGIAYTLQIIAQNGLNPTIASLIMSLESVFSVLAGSILLNEILSGRELFGCFLIFIAIVFAQIPFAGMRKGVTQDGRDD
ncbi:MAG: DMT family transporter [Clostridiales bacterium]|nr:DMT family transporter [Clostridiales bacterium]